MITNILLGTMMMVLTTGVHSVFTVAAVLMLNRGVHHRDRLLSYESLALISGTILMFFGAALIEVGIWAAAYLRLGAFEGVESAVYYSMVTFTTLGFGDIILTERWRLLSSIEAANGIIMFGWTTAVVMTVVQRTFAKVLEHFHRDRGSSST
ncbi:MAG: potassium channel family protein [Thermoanaerobaculales bacterium]|jgi:hypothetical protein|nr:potassium channel family protein [Thermoanaerobaculales bacterium]